MKRSRAEAATWLVIAFIAILVAAASVLAELQKREIYPFSGTQSLASGPVAVGEKAPLVTLPTLDPEAPPGERASLRDYLEGGASPRKALLVSFYAIWCQPCQHEMPFLAELASHNARAGLQVFLVSIDPESQRDQLRNQLFANGEPPFPVLLDTAGRAYKSYGIQGLPTVFLIGADGRVRYVSSGFGPAQREGVEKAVASVLAES